jgi:2-polyprenyl-3-methyl-5-hydroxy-6-metoxy-1,4-benzoquinol methylase
MSSDIASEPTVASSPADSSSPASASTATGKASRETVPQSCLICGETAYRVLKRFDDGVVVGECVRCGLMYTPLRHPVPESLLFGNRQDELQILHRAILSGRKKHFRKRNFIDYLERIERYAKGRRLLDVGCAHGFFPATARERGFEVTAVEPSPGMADFAEKNLNVNVLRGRLDQVDLGEGEWDVVTFTDSAEYIPTLVEDLRRVVTHLAPGGVLFLKVPNGDYFRMRHRAEEKFKMRIGGEVAFSPSLRVAHYSRHSLQRLARTLNLQVLEIAACPPIDSAPWHSVVGLHLEVEAPWFLDAKGHLMRRVLHALGQAQSRLCRGRNSYSPSIYLIARRP